MHVIPAARYLARRKRQNLLLGLLALVALCMLLLGVSVGNGVVRLPLGLSEHELALFVRLRLPRVLMGALVGAGLAMSGTLAQAVLRNPLASPFTLGISSGAAFGAALAIRGIAMGDGGERFCIRRIDGVCGTGLCPTARQPS